MLSRRIFVMSGRKRAGAGLSVCAAWHDPNTDFESAKFEYFYDVSAESVEVLAIVPKSEAAIWLEQCGKPE
jgi:hypothetical protein